MRQIHNKEQWHKILAHVHTYGIRQMIRINILNLISTDVIQEVQIWVSCVYGNITRSEIPKYSGST